MEFNTNLWDLFPLGDVGGMSPEAPRDFAGDAHVDLEVGAEDTGVAQDVIAGDADTDSK